MNVPVNIISDLSKKDIHINIRIIIRAKSNSVDSPNTYSPNDIFISKNPTFINEKEYNSILLREPYFKNNISMDKKFKSSTARFTISNLEFRGRIFSDYASNVSMLNKEVDIWYDTQSTKDAESSLLVYRGFISKFKHSKDECEIDLEDINIKKHQKTIPENKVSEQLNTKYVNKPIPIVYGYLKQAPTVIDNGIIKADSDPVNLITGLNTEYYNGGNGSTTSHYEGLGVFEGYGHNDSMRAKSPLSIYMNGMSLPVLNKQVFDQYADESNTGFNELQWKKTYDVDGQIRLYNLETNVNGVLQCQYIAKPHTISCINRSDMADDEINYYWLQYVNDSIETFQGFNGVDQFLENYKNSLVDNIIDGTTQGLNYFTDSVSGGNFNWSFYSYDSANEYVDALLGANININLIRLQYLYDPPFSIERYSDWHYLAINDTVMPRMYNVDATTGVKSVFICPQLSTSNLSNIQQANAIFESITNRPEFNILPLDGVISDYVEYLNQGDDYSHTLKNLFNFTDLETDSDYSGYTSPNYPNNWKPIEITNFSHNLDPPSNFDYPAQPYVLLAPNIYGMGNICFGVHGRATSDTENNINVSMEVQGHLNELTTYSIIEVSETQDKDFFLDVAGRASIIAGSSNATLTNVIEVIRDIAIREMGLDESQVNNNPNSAGYIGTAIDNNDINVAFSVNKETTVKKLIEELASHTLSFASFADDGTISFPTMKEQYTLLDDYSMATPINNKDIITYSFNLSPIQKVYTAVKVEYKHNYKTNKRDSILDFEYAFNETYEVGADLTTPIESFTFSRKNAMSPHEYEYYGYSSAYDNKLDFESKYICDESSALKLQERLFEYSKNQHLEIEIKLPLKYINLEIGSLIKFEELIDGMKAYGQNYTKISNPLWMHNETTSQTYYGQFYYPLFFVTSINKNSKNITIKATRLHCLKSGYVNIDNWISEGFLDTEQVYSYGDYGDESFYVDLGYIQQEQEEEVAEIEGCMDSNAENYNPDATIHVAGSCVYAESEPEQPYTYPDYTEHVGVRLLENYIMPATQSEWGTGPPEHQVFYAYGDDDTLPWQEYKYSHKFLPIKDVYIHQDLEYHFSEAQLSILQNDYGATSYIHEIPQFGQDYMDSTDDNSLINFRNEFVHPNNNLNIGSYYTPETSEFNSTGGGWKNTYEQIFETYYYDSQQNISNNAFWSHAGWGGTQNNTNEFWRRFVAMEIQIKDYRIYEFQGISNLNVSGDYNNVESTISAFIDAMPPTLPDWILNDYQGKITLALIAKNREPSADLNITNVELGWKIFPGHYDNTDDYMNNYDNFYNDFGQWVFNSEEDIGWGYVFPGNETWKNAFNFLYGGGLGDVNYYIFNLNTIFSAGGHSPEHQWMRVSLVESMGYYPHSINNGLYNLIKDVQENDWPYGMQMVTIPSKFGIYNSNMEPNVVYPTSEEYGHEPQIGIAGDMNLDGTISVLDMVAIVNAILDSPTSDNITGNGDFNQDGSLSILDIVAIIDSILGEQE